MAHIDLTTTVQMQQALADPTRIRIMRLLCERELCVCELVAAMEEPQYKVSRHLGVLKHAGLVRDRREGSWMHYAIAPTLPDAWREALTALCRVWEQSSDVQAALHCLRQADTVMCDE